MGWRFRKSIKILPGVRLNFGKKGITSATVGRGGWMSTNIGKKGVSNNYTLKGTGISYRTKPSGWGSGAGGAVTAARPCWACVQCGELSELNAPYCGACGHYNENRTWVEPGRQWSDGRKGALLALTILGFVGLCGVWGIIMEATRRPVTTSPTTFKSSVPAANAITTAPAKANTNSSPGKSKNSKAAKAVNKSATEIAPLAAIPYGSSTSRQPRSSMYIRGPRGGCYYINSHGNKTYVDRSLCD
jgi:hypothetical protein